MGGVNYARDMVGELLKRARLAAGLTQDELAFRAGIDRSYLSQLERDKKSPTLQMLFRLCKASGASVTGLIQELEQSGYGKSERL